jgi:hypothetical protein
VALPRLLAAWLAVAVWFLVWQEGRRRFGGAGAGDQSASWWRRTLPALAEALLLTLFAALWFASLGHGGWLLLFGLLGGLMESSVRLRSLPGSPFPWREVALGVARIVAAGALLAWRLG